MKNEYWLLQEGEKIVRQMQRVHNEWGIYSTSPFRTAWVRNVLAYYSPVLHPGSWDTSLVFEGTQGELLRMYTPQARSMTRQLVTLVTKNPLSFKCMAEVMDNQIMDVIKLGNAVTQQIVDQQRLEHKKKMLTESAIVQGVGFTYTRMRTDRGDKEPILDEDGAVVYDGAIDISVHTPFDVYYDSTVPVWDDVPWVEVRTMKSRWDLIAQFPDLTDEILAIPSAAAVAGIKTWFERVTQNDDMIYCWELYVRPCAAIPKGRMMFYAGEKCIFFDGINQYETLPVEPMFPEQVLGTTLGYPQFTNLMACQEMFDNTISAQATNISSFAVQNVAMPRGANVNVQEIQGMRFTFYTPQNVPGGGKPEVLHLMSTNAENYKFADYMENQMMKMSNLNAALRGAPTPGATSGVAIATLSANAIEFTTTIQEALNDCLSRTLKHALKCLVKFGANTERMVMMSGTNNQLIPKPYKGEDLKNVAGVRITLQNPLMQTIAGRLEIGEKLLQMPKDLWGEYVSILEGQPLSKLTKDELGEDDLIEAENEELGKGTMVPALITDDHAKHIKKHAACLNDPRIRLEGRFNEFFLQHIQEHYNLALEQDPGLTAMVRTGKIPEGGLQQMMPPQQPPPAVENQATMGQNSSKPATQMPSMPTAEQATDLLEGQR
jgi:hypothetical protein